MRIDAAERVGLMSLSMSGSPRLVQIIDSQVHIYGPDSAAFPWDPKGKGVAGFSRQVGVHLSPAVTAEDLLGQMDAIGVDAAVLVSFGMIYGFDNRYALDAVARYPERFALVGRLDPASADLAAEVAAFARRRNVVGVRVLALQPGQLAAGHFDRMFRAAEANGLVLCIYATEGIGELHRLAKAHPDLQIVLDHMCLDQPDPAALAAGQDPFAKLPEILELARHPNIAAKLTGIATLSKLPYPFADLWPWIHRIRDAFGPQRLMWGTDTTRTGLAYREELDFMRQSGELSEADKALLLGQTLQRIFKWSPAARKS
jgi:L-fuconolactonase